MNCNNCVNYVPKSPFNGVKTKDLRKGMLVCKHNLRYGPGPFLAVVDEPDEKRVRVINIYDGYKPYEDELYLADIGCQPYESGAWNQYNWLEEVK